MQKRKPSPQSHQLSLFEDFSSSLTRARPKEPTVLEFIRARFEYGPEMTKEEYKHFVKVLVNASIKRME